MKTVALAADDDAWGRLLDRVWPRLALWAAAVRSEEQRDVVDPYAVADQICARAESSPSPPDVRDRAAFLRWLFSIGGEVIEELDARLLQASGDERGSPALHRVRPAHTLRRLIAAIDSMEPECREAVRLVRVEALPRKVAAQRLGLDEPTLTLRYYRGLRVLARAVDEGEAPR